MHFQAFLKQLFCKALCFQCVNQFKLLSRAKMKFMKELQFMTFNVAAN